MRGHRSPEGGKINPALRFPPAPAHGIALLQLLPQEAFSFLRSIQAGMQEWTGSEKKKRIPAFHHRVIDLISRPLLLQLVAGVVLVAGKTGP